MERRGIAACCTSILRAFRPAYRGEQRFPSRCKCHFRASAESRSMRDDSRVREVDPGAASKRNSVHARGEPRGKFFADRAGGEQDERRRSITKGIQFRKRLRECGRQLIGLHRHAQLRVRNEPNFVRACNERLASLRFLRRRSEQYRMHCGIRGFGDCRRASDRRYNIMAWACAGRHCGEKLRT